ncbi:LysR family transcriptional regulator [Corynebacterium sp. AOP40-9SA-29]|uniref:LysR family transcriptional regulator n=1 Tax=Corynebacterium sp. AOP40-9SA-29 TaxID=3457677 RepID=UPI0040345D80
MTEKAQATTQGEEARAGEHVDLNLLRTFLTVYRAGSFTAAAAQVGLSQPTVTAQIRSLENLTTQRLFTRLPRGVEPTPAADELAARVSVPLDALSVLDGGTGSQRGRTSPVHLAGPSELLCTRVLPALSELVASGVQLRVRQGLTDPLMDDLRAGQQDLIICTRRPRGRALESHPLTDEEYVLVASPRWADHVRDITTESGLCVALHGVPLVTYADDMPIVRRYWRTVFGKQRPPASVALTVPNLHAVVSAVASGAGYSVLPQSLCEEHLRDGRLILLADPEEPPLNTLFLVQRPGSEANPDVERVRDALIQAAGGW